MKSTLETRTLIFAFLVLTLTITINTGFNIDGFRRDYRDGILLRSHNIASDLKNSIEKVLALGISLTEMEGINARCQEIVGTDPEIAYCRVEDATGEPRYSSDPSFRFPENIEHVSTMNPTTNILESPLWGKFYDVSLPIYAPEKQHAGQVRIGFLDTVLDERTSTAFERSFIVLGIAFLFVFGMVVLFARRDLVLPIRNLSSIANDIASGNFQVEVPKMSTADFAELGGALQEMANSLEERDQQILQGYAELEEANRELQLSYEHQERISGELRRSREMYRSLLEEASDAILVSDEEDRIVLVNKAAERFFGMPREQTEGANFFTTLDRLQSDGIEQQYAAHQQVLQGENLQMEVRFVRPSDQQPVVGWASASSVVGQDGTRMVQSVFRDVTREREIKGNLEKSARELERLNQMKDSFLGVASHELKTPLTVIIGYAELILTEMKTKVDPGVLPMVQHIADAAERLASIIRDMLDVSMLDSKRLPLNSRKTDINRLIQESVRELGFFFNRRNQSLVLKLSPQLPEVECDSDRMIQVIANLVGNAIKFTPDGGSIRVETRVVDILRPPYVPYAFAGETLKVIDSHPYSYVEIIVSDTGIGIAEKDHVHVFEKFYEVGKIEEHFTGKTAFKGKGTGLGLTIVKGIIDMHGGEVWVESPGHDPESCPGSSFHLLLPLGGGASAGSSESGT